MKNLRHVWFIALNTFRLFVTDRMAVIMFILFPFLFIVMFNILLGNTSGQGHQTTTAPGYPGNRRHQPANYPGVW